MSGDEYPQTAESGRRSQKPVTDEPDILRKQFIAGAVCPECGVLDRIVVEYTNAPAGQDGELSRRRCVQCGFTDPFGAPAAAEGTGAVPRGKPERSRAVEVTATPVNIVDPRKSD